MVTIESAETNLVSEIEEKASHSYLSPAASCLIVCRTVGGRSSTPVRNLRACDLGNRCCMITVFPSNGGIRTTKPESCRAHDADLEARAIRGLRIWSSCQ